MRRGFFYFIIIALVIGAALYGFIGSDGRQQLRNMLPFLHHDVSVPTTASIAFPSVTVTAERATTPAAQSRGLGQRDSLASNAGMLFEFNDSQTYGFWMKDMRFPIDIIWIANGTVIDVDANVPVVTSGTLPVYTPVAPVDRVLEVNAGFAAAHGITVGTAAVITVDGSAKP